MKMKESPRCAKWLPRYRRDADFFFDFFEGCERNKTLPIASLDERVKHGEGCIAFKASLSLPAQTIDRSEGDHG